jgi:hypothetical protein
MLSSTSFRKTSTAVSMALASLLLQIGWQSKESCREENNENIHGLVG